MDVEKTVIAKWYIKQRLLKVAEFLQTITKLKNGLLVLSSRQCTSSRCKNLHRLFNCFKTENLFIPHTFFSVTLQCSLMWKWSWMEDVFSSKKKLLKSWDNEWVITLNETWYVWSKDWFRIWRDVLLLMETEVIL